ncbi:phage portal protein [Solwaraspora sp. WMMD792]|uniref:phage portal protein n=1 Tax=Solwaraspora sp. WMMD792 TaxID=3016099 RepID=UPI002415E5E8|nr:phage portal protein [Solwaraspora sp. WMMD792]MDG4768936.1 phage portal protein [Solwaraspora sp. WMMD792]MDG4769011.1 phage portal protein [Solwaraspora sp. WMMD792]
MALTAEAAATRAGELRRTHESERAELDVLRRYWTGKQRLPAVIPSDAPREVREMARISRVNVIDIVVNSLTQALFVDGLRARDPQSGDDVTPPVWSAWLANRMNKHQAGLHRATVAYGTGYLVITPGDPYPVMRPRSPRQVTAMYGEDPDWAEIALEKLPVPGRWRLYDNTVVYGLVERGGRLDAVSADEHGFDRPPVVRYRDAEDLDADDDAEPELLSGGLSAQCRVVVGQVAPLMPMQDQLDLTSFSLKGAEWYSAFRQRWAIGWTPEDRDAKMRSAASQFWTFDAMPDEMRLGEFSQTELSGYLASRESTSKFVATLSQTPVHELIGELVNLSAEALAAAEAGRDRKVDERKTGMGESHEQSFQVVGALMGVPVPDDAEVVWRDTSAAAFAAVVDGLGKLAQMLGVPAQELWDRIPGVTQQDIRRFKAAAAQGDALANLTSLLDRQATGPDDGDPDDPGGAGGADG